jgi:hypothetical protein
VAKKIIKLTESEFKSIITNMLVELTGGVSGWWEDPNHKSFKNYLSAQTEWKITYPVGDVRNYGVSISSTEQNWVFYPQGDFIIFKTNTSEQLSKGTWTESNSGIKIKTDDGDSYDSIIGKWAGTSNSSDENLYVNCANSLDEIIEGSNKILKRGCKTDAVKELQKLLGMEEKYQTGFFGKITKGKVVEFQESNKDADGKDLNPDGIVGPRTYGALKQ